MLRGCGSMGKGLSIVLLMFLSFAIPELLTGSTPFWVLANPVSLSVLLVVYGFPALLYREVRLRYGLQGGGLLLLGLCQGLLVEGLAVNTFYSNDVGKLGVFARYGRFLGVNWPWAIYLTMFHSIFSVYVPIMVAESIVPELWGRSLIGWSRRNLAVLVTGTAFVVVLFQFGEGVYHPNPAYQLAALAVLVLAGAASIRAGLRPPPTRALIRYPDNGVAIALFPIVFITAEFFAASTILPPSLHILLGAVTYYAIYNLVSSLDHRRECEEAVLMMAGLSVNGLIVAFIDAQYHIIPPALVFLALTAFLYHRLRS